MSDPANMQPVVALPLEEDLLQDLVEKGKDYALMHGICMRRKDMFDRDALHFAPFVLFPTPFPRKEYERAISLQPILNILYHKIAYDHEFLESCLKLTVKVDEFTGRLWEIYTKVRAEGGSAQPLSLGMTRSDLMLDTHCCKTKGKRTARCTNRNARFSCWKQVEFNTIASGFGWMGPASGMIHRYLAREAGLSEDDVANIPENLALEGLSRGLLNAWKIYGNSKSVILFLIEDVTYNICDQKFHEFEIRRQCPQVFVIRKTLTEIGERGQLTEDKRLIIDGKEVGVIYMRCGYHPSQYPSEVEWDARLLMERSLAIKSPSIQYHLAGTKKVQQELAKAGMVERFLSDPGQVAAVRSIFTGLYSLDLNQAGDEAVRVAMEKPHRFVLKPQREGGGNNVYGENIKPFLENIKDSPERNAYILMDRIHPPVTKNYMVRPLEKEARFSDVISELGIFGYIIGDGETILENEQVGHMLRTKLSHVDEGGVAAGLGALDSLYLVEEGRCCPSENCIPQPLNSVLEEKDL